MVDEETIRRRFAALGAHLDERGRRRFAAIEARLAGYGGIAAVSRATGIAASTIGRGLCELDDPAPQAMDRVRRPGGGRKRLVETDERLLADLEALVEPEARGDPMSPLRWTPACALESVQISMPPEAKAWDSKGLASDATSR